MIAVRDLAVEDLVALLRWRNDPVVNCHLADRLKTREEIESWFSRLRADSRTWLKAIMENDRRIGYATVESIDGKNRKCELALVIGENDCWGRGVGAVVLKMMLEYAFEELHMHRVWAAVAKGNERSERLLKRAGFVPEGSMREAIIIGGTYTDLLCYSMLEYEYNAQKT